MGPHVFQCDLLFMATEPSINHAKPLVVGHNGDSMLLCWHAVILKSLLIIGISFKISVNISVTFTSLTITHLRPKEIITSMAVKHTILTNTITTRQQLDKSNITNLTSIDQSNITMVLNTKRKSNTTCKKQNNE